MTRLVNQADKQFFFTFYHLILKQKRKAVGGRTPPENSEVGSGEIQLKRRLKIRNIATTHRVTSEKFSDAAPARCEKLPSRELPRSARHVPPHLTQFPNLEFTVHQTRRRWRERERGRCRSQLNQNPEFFHLGSSPWLNSTQIEIKANKNDNQSQLKPSSY